MMMTDVNNNDTSEIKLVDLKEHIKTEGTDFIIAYIDTFHKDLEQFFKFWMEVQILFPNLLFFSLIFFIFNQYKYEIIYFFSY